EEAFLAAFNGTTDNDSFNRLVLLSGLLSQEAAVMRAYARYLRQTGFVYSQALIADTLTKYPQISRTVFQLFHDRFDPSLTEKSRMKRLSLQHQEIETALGNVPS